MFDIVSQNVLLNHTGEPAGKLEPNYMDVNRFKEKVEEKLKEGWKLKQFSSTEWKNGLFFIQTFTK